MVRIKISGIPVEIPYDPYPPQLVTISKLIECFQTGTNSLIESPTGTGKSLSIICSVLAYYEYERRNNFSSTNAKDTAIGNASTASMPTSTLPTNTPATKSNNNSSNTPVVYRPFKIFICSRTHKQIDQLVEQLRKTVYRPRITILGSKNQYCINSALAKVDDKNTACSDLVKTKKCSFFMGKDRLVKRIADRIFDIEELKAEGKKCGGCPYFAARGLQEDAEVIFAPYNYLIDTSIREASEINLENAILIIDEAHNIEDCCRAAGSLELQSKTVEIVMSELISATKRSALMGEIKNEFLNLLSLFRKFKEASESAENNELPSSSSSTSNNLSTGKGYDSKGYSSSSYGNNNLQRIKRGKEIISELASMGITKEAFLVYKNALHAINKDTDAKELIGVNTARLLQEVERVLGMVLFTGSDAYSYCFTRYGSGDASYKSGTSNAYKNTSLASFHSGYAPTGGYPSDTSGRYCYSLWLLDPSIMFLPLVSRVRSISLLSGTLTPFSSFCSELKYAFQHKVIAPHIIKDEQVFITSIRRGHMGTDLCGTYAAAETPGYLDQVAKTVLDIANAVKNDGGTLVFVSSYALLNKLAAKLPGAVLEPREGGMVEFERAVESYKLKIQKRFVSIFLCVYRGKASEGIDFRDEFARAVVAIGIPFPSNKDPQIMLKKEYNTKNGGYNGKMWYDTQAYRALNQALGRAIRHSGDWGSVFLLDSRYCIKQNQNGLPTWVTSRLKAYDSFANVSEDFKKFVKKFSDTTDQNIKNII